MVAITPQVIGATYTYFRLLAPFNRWNLPPAKGIRFVATLATKECAHFSVVDDGGSSRPEIAVHPHRHLSVLQLQASVAHEMVHLRQYVTGRWPVAGGRRPQPGVSAVGAFGVRAVRL